MELILAATLLLAAGSAAWLYKRNQNDVRQIERPWKQAAKTLGLAYIPPSSVLDPVLVIQGTFDRCRVEASYAYGRSHSRMMCQVQFDGAAAKTIAIRRDPERQLKNLEGAMLEKNVPTGDKAFDDVHYLTGDASTVRAVMGKETREKTAVWLRGGREIGRGRLHSVEENPETIRSSKTIEETLEPMFELASLYSVQQSEIPEKLMFNALNDELVEVRRKSFETLVKSCANSDAAKRTADELKQCDDPKLRFIAATYLGLETAEAGALSLSDDESRVGALALERSEGALSLADNVGSKPRE